MTRRTTEARVRDRADLLAIIQEADGPVSLYRLAEDTHDGTAHWERHLNQVFIDLRALRKAGVLVSEGVPWESGRMLWGLADSSLGEEISDRADLARQMAGWEEAPLPEVPC